MGGTSKALDRGAGNGLFPALNVFRPRLRKGTAPRQSFILMGEATRI